MQEPMIFFVVIVMIVALVFLYLYYDLKANLGSRIQEAVSAWRDREIDRVYREQLELASKNAQGQLQQWREDEVESIKKQQLETARKEALVQLEKWKEEQTGLIRKEAIQKSQAVTMGKISEHFVPYLPDFRYNPKDARFIGSPVDLIVFNGLDEDKVESVIFVEVKTGKSGLTTRERRVRDAIQARNVEWLELRFDAALSPTQITEQEDMEAENGETSIVQIVQSLEQALETKSTSTDPQAATSEAAIAKLVALGYPRARCEIAVQRVLAGRDGDELSVEELVKEGYFSL